MRLATDENLPKCHPDTLVSEAILDNSIQAFRLTAIVCCGRCFGTAVIGRAGPILWLKQASFPVNQTW
jgi:hypothetical protein